MEYNENWVFLVAIAYFLIPFGVIYFTLYILNWNEKKNTFSDSWFVFIIWAISSFFTFLIADSLYRSISNDKLIFNKLAFGITLGILVLAINTLSITIVLYFKSRKTEKFSLIAGTERKIQKKISKRIWCTSFLVSLITCSAIVSLFIALTDISQKIDEMKPKKQEGEKVSFGLYDF